ncbi:RrF2 family transcriptional regulator [candidate division KSB1 bacterium]
MNFSKTTSYSLKILSFMSEDEDVSYSAKYLHEKLKIPWQYLRQLLTILSKNGFVRSTRGRSGGFILNKKTDQIFIADVVDAIEGLNIINTCIMGFEECPFNQTCALHDTWVETRENILNVLKSNTIANFKKSKK